MAKSDQQFDDAFKAYRSGLLSADAFFGRCLETADRRSKLIKSFIPIAQMRLDFAITKRRRWHEGGYGVFETVRRLKRIKDALTGEEVFDRTRFFALFGDLRALLDEQKTAAQAIRGVR